MKVVSNSRQLCTAVVSVSFVEINTLTARDAHDISIHKNVDSLHSICFSAIDTYACIGYNGHFKF